MNFDAVTKFLSEGEEHGAGPGRGCAVFYKHQPVFRHVSGYRNKENEVLMSGDEFYNLFSCTKIMTCTAALMLYERGKFSFDDPVAKYIPEFADMMIETTNKNAEKSLQKALKKIKIIHLFTMSAGMDYELFGEETEQVKRDTGGRCPTNSIAKALAKRPLLFEPGARFNYSLCHDILGALIEIWSGASFGDFIKSAILDRLYMNETYFKLPEEKLERRATLYNYNQNAKRVDLYKQELDAVFGDEYESGGAGLITTLDDYVKFCEMLCRLGTDDHGAPLLKRQTVEMLRTPVFDKRFQDGFQQSVSWGKGYHYGLGVYVLVNQRNANSLAAPFTFGWDGAAGCYVSIDISNKITIFYTQQMFGNTPPYHCELRNLIYKAILKGE